MALLSGSRHTTQSTQCSSVTMPGSSEAFRTYQSTRYFSSLDGFRAISILAVIFYHVPQLRPIWRTGYLGVHLFFVISGFLITTLLLREKARNGRVSLRKFYARRTLRIFPAYYLTLGLFLVTCLIFPELHREALPTYLHNLPSFLTYTSNWFVYPWGPGRVVFLAAWSLATEEQFYLFWPWIVSRSSGKFVPVTIMCALVFLSNLIKWKAGYFFFLTGYSFPIIFFNSISVAICFGCLFALLLDTQRGFGVVYRLIGAKWFAPVAVIVMAIVCCVPNDDILHTGHMLIVISAMTLAIGACVVHEDTWVRPIFTIPAVRYIGAVSYGMYLYHAFGINISEKYFLWSAKFPPLYFAIIVALTLAMASASFWFFERPFLKLKDRFSARTIAPKATIPFPAIPEELPLSQN